MFLRCDVVLVIRIAIDTNNCRRTLSMIRCLVHSALCKAVGRASRLCESVRTTHRRRSVYRLFSPTRNQTLATGSNGHIPGIDRIGQQAANTCRSAS